MGLFTKDLSEPLARRFKEKAVGNLQRSEDPDQKSASVARWETAKIWIVFLACFVFSLLGVFGSFLLFGNTITGTRKWGFAVVISVVMLGLSYGAKYSNADARMSFTPVDVLQYLSQGILWPSTWPALAKVMGVQAPEGPGKATATVLWGHATTITSFFC